ncbi:glycosyltransferase family 2 protein [Pedobacter sp. BMA]|uniref:glycosyltransferase family 2 protein n=1 Tax=Pedobacter sp. BMA TaxID=1663685 RepID=UPI00064AC217|nr:glycosyltransferase family 2 protein [Pedobacter sp. BMA]KLT66633.1 hypothetical protein AB669_05525 [Pedobacter sp. BMA]
MTEPLVSIIIPLYNAEDFVKDCIYSAINQTWENKEIIVVDDGSTDNSLNIVNSFNDERITVISQKNKGASAARNKGLEAARGKYIQFLDADDILGTEKIATQVKSLSTSEEHLSLCHTVHFDDGTDPFQYLPQNEWYSKDIADPIDFLIKLYSGSDILPGFGGMIQPNAWLVPLTLIHKAGLWNEKLTTDDDGEFFCRVLVNSSGIKFADKGINYYRKHKNLVSLSNATNHSAFGSIYHSIGLKYDHLNKFVSPGIIDIIFSRFYWELALSSYPLDKTLSAKAIKKSRTLSNKKFGYSGGTNSKMISKLLGWKAARLVSFIRLKIINGTS